MTESSQRPRPLRLIIFAKAPLAGFAKTRLIPALGPGGAAELAERMLGHSLRQCLAAGLGPVELCVAPDVQHDYWLDFTLPLGVQLTGQGGGDLGQRMARAAARAGAAGEAVVLLGTDCPMLSADRLAAAAAALKQTDAVVYPTRDGGYALLGLNRFEPALFEGIAWSTQAVAQQTRERLTQCAMDSVWLETLVDIDEPEDLEFLPQNWRESR